MGGATGSTNATISTFLLDKFEVTVGRFRKFQAAYTGHPENGAGAHPLVVGSGWRSPEWDGLVAADASVLATAVQCNASYQTWKTSGANDRLPIDCVNWYEAFAFCAWDGGRLPTEAEWEYAAAAGDEERRFPWGTPAPDDTLGTAAYANYDCMGDGSAPAKCAPADILAVGSKPLGIGKYGQLDLGGSIWEWTLDMYATSLPATCDNCANLIPGAYLFRVMRGGSWLNTAAYLPATYRLNVAPDDHSRNVGIRCARNP
jgi:formylglycine-generating enzyme required for sulfatase activity